MSHTLLPPPETEEKAALRAADLFELNEQIRLTEQLIHRLREQLHRLGIRHANYSIERSRLITRLAEPVHFTPEPCRYVAWRDLPAHSGDESVAGGPLSVVDAEEAA